VKHIVLPALLLSVLSLPAGAIAGQDSPAPDVLRNAAAAYQAGDMAGAIRLYREFLKEYPHAAEIRSNLGAALVRSGQFAEAIQEYRAALEQLPNNPRVRMNLALAYYKLGRIREAVGELETLHKMQPLESKSALLLADCLVQAGQPEKAVDLLTPFEQDSPDDHAVVYALGMALLKLNRTDRAQVLLDRILRDGQSAESEYLLGQSEYLRQNNLAAAKYLENAVKLNPNLPGAHSLYGLVLKEIGQPDLAAEQFRQELEGNAYDFAANVETAMLSKQDGKLEEALGHVERALQVRPADPGALYLRASIHSMQGLSEQARQELEQLVRDYPNYSEAHAALAAVYYRLKRTGDGDRERAAARRAQEETQKLLEERRKRAAEPESPARQPGKQ
jgi:tetratricopeptide (TPR) repeat protein